MGFKKNWDVGDIMSQVRRMIGEIRSPYNDGFTGLTCKHELYLLKCFIDDQYNDLPKFGGEEEWEQQRLIQKLRQ